VRRIDARLLLPVLSLALLLGAVFWMQPRAMSYTGLNLLLNLAVPIALATVAQMLVIMVDDIDLSIGTFVSFCACVTATFLHDAPLLGLLVLAASVAAYAALGALIEVRKLPAIVVTLGMSFVWGRPCHPGAAAPGGAAPPWLRALMTVRPPVAAHGHRGLRSPGARGAPRRHALVHGHAPAGLGRQRPGRGAGGARPRQAPGAGLRAGRVLRASWPGSRSWGSPPRPTPTSRCATRSCPSQA
jgi:hypothetical protein